MAETLDYIVVDVAAASDKANEEPARRVRWH
jgi:hypothetical protein